MGNPSNPIEIAKSGAEAASAIAAEVAERLNSGARQIKQSVVGTIFDIAAPVVRDISTELIKRIDLAPLAKSIADSVDVSVVAMRVADAVEVEALAEQVVQSIDIDPIIDKLRGELGPIVQEVLEELELGVLAERVLDQLDLPTLITGTIEELRMGSVVRAAIRRPRPGHSGAVELPSANSAEPVA